MKKMVLACGLLMAASLSLGSHRASAQSAACDLPAQAGHRKTQDINYINKWWAKVDATFLKILATNCPLNDLDWYYGGVGAMNIGDIGSAFERFSHVSHHEPSEVAMLKPRFGKVNIEVQKGLVLARTAGPSLASEGVAALEWGKQKIVLKGGINGYLPVGTYSIGNATFDVKSGSTTAVTYNPKLGFNIQGP